MCCPKTRTSSFIVPMRPVRAIHLELTRVRAIGLEEVNGSAQRA